MIKTNFVELFLRKQSKEGKRLSLQDMHKETGLSWSTLQRWENENVTRFDAKVLDEMCKYFSCSVCDLVQYVADEMIED